jgi:hypothetical protein
MKNLLSLILFTLSISASVIDRRGWNQNTPAPLKAYKIESMAPLTLPTAKRMKMIYGPYKIRGTKNKSPMPGMDHSMDPAGTAYTNMVLDSVTRVLNSTFHSVNTADGIYSHHTAFID